MTLFGPLKPVPALVANRLARWAILLNQFDNQIQYRTTDKHQNANALSRLTSGDDPVFDKENNKEDVDIVCACQVLSLQVQPPDSFAIQKKTVKDPVFSNVISFTRESWPKELSNDDPAQDFRRVEDSLSIAHNCLLYGSRIVIPTNIQPQILSLLHEGHFGIQRMKQVARTAVYWRKIDDDVTYLCRHCARVLLIRISQFKHLYTPG